MGLEEAKDALEHAVVTLADMTEDLHPDLGDNLKEILEQDFLRPLKGRTKRLDNLLEQIAMSTP